MARVSLYSGDKIQRFLHRWWQAYLDGVLKNGLDRQIGQAAGRLWLVEALMEALLKHGHIIGADNEAKIARFQMMYEDLRKAEKVLMVKQCYWRFGQTWSSLRFYVDDPIQDVFHESLVRWKIHNKYDTARCAMCLRQQDALSHQENTKRTV